MKPQFNPLCFCIEMPLIGDYSKGRIPDFFSSALSMSSGKVITLRRDLTAATTVGYYTFISHGSITLHIYRIDVHI